MVSDSLADKRHRLTGEELWAMGDIGPCELIDGRIVQKAHANFQHGLLVVTIGSTLGGFTKQQRCGRVVMGGVGLYTRRNPDRVRGVDIAFISYQRLPGHMPKAYFTVAPELIIEIVSPTDRWSDFRQKLEEYFSIGVERVWIIEPEDRVVLVYRSSTESTRLTETDTLRGEGLLDGFIMPVADLFMQE